MAFGALLLPSAVGSRDEIFHLDESTIDLPVPVRDHHPCGVMTVAFLVPFLAATGLLAAPLVPVVLPAAKRLSCVCMRGEGLSEYEKYQRARGADSFKDAEDQYKTVRAVITPFKWLLLACLK